MVSGGITCEIINIILFVRRGGCIQYGLQIHIESIFFCMQNELFSFGDFFIYVLHTPLSLSSTNNGTSTILKCTQQQSHSLSLWIIRLNRQQRGWIQFLLDCMHRWLLDSGGKLSVRYVSNKVSLSSVCIKWLFIIPYQIESP